MDWVAPPPWNIQEVSMKKIYQYFLYILAVIIYFATNSTINSACKFTNYQDIEPHSLMRLKKIKDK